MRLLVVLIAILSVSSLSMAQTDCSESQTFCDTGCSNDPECQPTGFAGCTSTAFTPACTGNYIIQAWTVCEGDINCDHCRASVVVEDGTTVIKSCATKDCKDGVGHCCENCGSVSLTANHTYGVSVCLSLCPPTEMNCDACTEGNCQACACLRLGAWPSPCCVNE